MDLLEIEIEPGRAIPLADANGIYGLAIAWLDYKGEPRRSYAIYRPDRLPNRLAGWDERLALQQIPQLGAPWSRCAEGRIADELLTAMLARARLQRHGYSGPGPWWSDAPEIQAANRRRFHALKHKAIVITNSLVRQALVAAPPDALRLARRFSPMKRFSVYRAISRSSRMMQLTEVFPLLAWQIITNDHAEAQRLVEAGAKLNTIASLMKVPMAFRGLKPGAVFSLLDWFAELKDELIYATLPTTTLAQRRWLLAVSQSTAVGGTYVDWTARNCHLLGCTTGNATAVHVSDIGDWVRASYIVGVPKHVRRALSGGRFSYESFGDEHITRPFSPDMSVNTVKELSSAWHEAVALSDPKTNVPLPAPWRGATSIGDISVVPLDTAAAIAAEGRAMHHCARTIIPKVKSGDSYLFSARDGDQRIATIEVTRNGEKISINQMRGACNSMLPKPLQAKLTRWAGERDKWNLPIREPVKAVHFGDDIPF
jgi:PcfJ-like protein